MSLKLIFVADYRLRRRAIPGCPRKLIILKVTRSSKATLYPLRLSANHSACVIVAVAI